ncbi:non-hydrolyzing UDP-N-acetylglucosamine 2-epimerase [Halarchaeum sp. P4]|uniref:non-hydrolyzing UDP-N-acetylglucosamine 2-epimerase n=1 Tax=Halarchaeum sp. P4 TaxID=3421639 RepID=UPI003EB7D564
MSRVVSVVGARPQFVKAFPVSGALRDAGHEEVLVHTGQHYDAELSDVFFDELAIPEPDYNLGVGSDDHGAQTAAVMRRLDDVLDSEDPDAVLVYGDTNSTLGAALVAAKRDVALAHVEAGLRSGDRSMPEEVNRLFTDHAADHNYAPAERAADRLRAEGAYAETVVTGDVMYDAVLAVEERDFGGSSALADHGVTADEFVLATVHRAANTDDPDRLAGILDGLASLPGPVVLPLHPRTDAALEAYGLAERARADLDVVAPLGYLDFLRLLDGARAVATDSGGVQKEAFYLDTPCVTLREETEWTETVEAGWNTLVGTDPAAIRAALTGGHDRPAKPSLYGDGDAADHIAEALERVA